MRRSNLLALATPTLVLGLALQTACGGGGGGGDAAPATTTPPTTIPISTGPQVVLNGDFEQGAKIWNSDNAVVSKNYASDPRIVVHGGTYMAWLCGNGSTFSDRMWQDVYVPSTATSATLAFWLKIVTDETGTAVKDTFTVKVMTPANATLGTLLTKSNVDGSSAYAQQVVDLMPYKGQVIRLMFTGVEDSSGASSFLLDDLAVNIQVPTATDLAPIIDSFTPTSGVPGETTVTINGRNFFGVTGLTVNGAAASTTVVDGTKLTAPVPPTATQGNGSITVTNAQGTGTSGTSFSATYGLPTISALNPSQGPVGTPLVITGTHLDYPGATVTVNGVAATVTAHSMTQLTVTVPAGATGTGNVVVTSGGNTASKPFTVNGAAATLDLHIEALQLTQSTQTLTNTVPIVAGKKGLIRVFVLANQINSAAPVVQVVLKNNGVAVWGAPKTISAPAASVPTTLTEGDLTASWNLVVDGADLATPTGSGYTLEATVDPTAAIAEADTTNNALTAALTGVAVPTFKTTIFPVVLTSGTGNVSGANLTTWVARLKKMYPVAAVDAQVGAPFTGSVNSLVSDDADGHWSTLLSDLATKHQADSASDRYYYGALNVSYGSGIAGLGYVPGTSNSGFQYRTAIGWDKTGYSDGGNFPEVFAHETGHNMGRPHSPCGGAGNPDPAYPYSGAFIGQWGYDSDDNVLMSPTVNRDIMAYCRPNWVSDYVYKKILTFRNGTGGFLTVGADAEDAPQASTQATECVLVRGILHRDGRVTFLPGFRTRALPTVPAAGGDLRLRGLDASGRVMFDQAVTPASLGCGPLEGEQHFVLALPAADLASLQTLQAHRQGLLLAEKRAGSTAAKGTAARVVADPELRQVAEGWAQVRWDVATQGEAVMVRDAETGEVLAIGTGGQHRFATAKAHGQLDLVFSNGVTGTTQRTALKR